MLSIVYYLIYVIILYGTFEQLNKGVSLKTLYWIIIGVLIFLAGFRYNTGADYFPYVELFYGSQLHIPWADIFEADIEASYVLFSKILGSLQLPFYWLTFTYAFLSISLKAKTFYNYSPVPFLSLLFYFMPIYFFEDAGQIRQGLSIGICAYSYKYIKERKLFWFLLFVSMAYYTHKTAIVFLPAYWIAKLKIDTKAWFLIIGLAVILIPFKVYSLLGPLLENFASDKITDSYTGYLNDEMYGKQLDTGIGDIHKIIFLIFLFLGDSHILKKYPSYLYIRNLTFFYFFLYYIMRGNSIFAVRLPGVYAFFFLLSYAYLAVGLQHRYRKIFITYLIIYSILITWRFGSAGESVNFDEISNVWFESN